MNLWQHIACQRDRTARLATIIRLSAAWRKEMYTVNRPPAARHLVGERWTCRRRYNTTLPVGGRCIYQSFGNLRHFRSATKQSTGNEDLLPQLLARIVRSANRLSPLGVSTDHRSAARDERSEGGYLWVVELRTDLVLVGSGLGICGRQRRLMIVWQCEGGRPNETRSDPFWFVIANRPSHRVALFARWRASVSRLLAFGGRGRTYGPTAMIELHAAVAWPPLPPVTADSSSESRLLGGLRAVATASALD